MKYKQILSFFSLALPISIAVRFFQIINTVESETGFFESEYKTQGMIMTGIVVVLAALVAIFALNSHRKPEYPPRISTPLAFASMFFAMSLLYEIFTEDTASGIQPWQALLLKITGVLAIAYFVVYAVKGYINIKLPNICAALPVVYFIVRIICSFISVSASALVSDDLFLLSSYSAVVLFMLQFGKLYNGLDKEYNFRKLLSSGLLSIILCFSQAIPHIAANLISGGDYLHTAYSSSISLLFTGVFILVFILSHFSTKNCQ